MRSNRICLKVEQTYTQDLIVLDRASLVLPYPPSVNTYWRSNGKRRFISKAGVDFSNEVQSIVYHQNKQWFGERRLKVNIIIYPRSKRLFDLDNCLKAILDALMKAGCYADDSQVDFLHIERGVQTKGGGCEVEIIAV